jgi:predicted metal-dependent hydrolase
MTTPAIIPYRLVRSRRKTISIQVKNGEVEVRAPLQAPLHTIEEWVLSKQGWVKTRLAEEEKRNHERPAITHGGRLLFFGELRAIEIVSGTPGVEELGNRLVISHRRGEPVKVLAKWLQQEAQLYITERVNEIAAQMGEGGRIGTIHFRRTRSKWGHCTSEGNLQFNWLIIMAPPEVIDYLIIHEISHLKHMNHSGVFWQRVERFCPHHRQHRGWLKKNGHRIWLD